MHASAISPSILARLNAMKGESNQIAVIPSKTAHVVVDLQVGFIAPGALVEVPAAREIVDPVNRISAAIRQAGAINAFIRFTVDLDEARYWTPMYDRMTNEARASFVGAFAAGAEQHKLWPQLQVEPQDLIVDKTRFSAFIPGTCSLHDQLSTRGIDTLIVTGTVTNCCCESTVRDAMQLGYKVLFIQDGNAALDDDSHNATLANMAGLFFADVCTADEAIARLQLGSANEVAL